MKPPEIMIPPDLRRLLRDIKTVHPNPLNARTHSRKQRRALAKIIRNLGFINPIVVDGSGMILAGHGRHDAAQELGMTLIPVIVLSEMTEVQKRAYALADNQLATLAGWDRGLLATELGILSGELSGLGLTVTDLGFSGGEINAVIEDRGPATGDPADATPGLARMIVSGPGSHWKLGPLEHEIYCGDARSQQDVEKLLRGTQADMAFVDKSYNISIPSLAGGRGSIKHDECAMPSGEMAREAFKVFTRETDIVLAGAVRNGGIVYSCTDWRSLDLFLGVAKKIFGTLLTIVVWDKTNASQGSFYRSQHEFILVLKVGDAPHCKGVELGKKGGNRSNVWTYREAKTPEKGRTDDLAAHPTVKPVALVADAIKDCTLAGDTVLDTFLGSGTTLIAAEKVGRRCLGLEIEPKFVDVAIRRWQASTGLDAVCALTGRTFAEIEQASITDESASTA
jgi:DNA modification methylase